MKRALLLLALSAVVGACATHRMSDADQLALYRAHAGDPVNHFTYSGNIMGWAPLGDSALTVSTRPNQAYLLELVGPCMDLDYAPTIIVTSQFGRVTVGFDDVIVRGGGSHIGQVPCRIKEIRPLDLKGLKQAQSEVRQAEVTERRANANDAH